MRRAIVGLLSGAALVLSSVIAARAAGIITTIAGGGPAPGMLATDQPMQPISVLFDPAGNLYISDDRFSRVQRRDAATGILVPVAGRSNEFGRPCGTDLGDGGPATAACIQYPGGAALDAAGNLYVADFGNARIRKVDASTGDITTVAGGGTGPLGDGDGGPATLATLTGPYDVALDGAGNLFIAEVDGRRIRRVDAATGLISTVTTALLQPLGITAKADGTLYVADGYASRVFSIAPGGGSPVPVAGNGNAGFCGDGGPATSACLWGPSDVGFDDAGNLLIADRYNNRIRRVDATTGGIETIAGIEHALACTGDQGNEGPATAACLESPGSLTLDGAGNIAIADVYGWTVRRIDAATGIITRFAGNGTTGFCGDGGPATGACLNGPYGVTRDGAGNLFIADFNNGRIRKVDAATGVIDTVAAGSADGASLATDVAVDLDGNLLFPAEGNVVRRLDLDTGVIATLYGTPPGGYCGDGGDATVACFFGIDGLAVDQAGNVFLADSFNARVRRIDGGTRIVTTVAGNGTYDYCGDGGPATQACLFPTYVAVDPAGNLYISDVIGRRVRRVDAQTHVITTIAGGGTAPCVEGGPATANCINVPAGLTADVFGNVFVADESRVRRIDAATGTITTAAGTSNEAYCGDGGPATSACLYPRSIVIDPDGALIISDLSANRIRRVSCDGPDSDGDGRCDLYDFDEVQGLTLRSASVQRRGFKGRAQVDVELATGAFSPVADPADFFAQVRASGFTIRAIASAAPPELAQLAAARLTPATCRFSPSDAAVPARVRCKVAGLIRARVRLGALGGGRYRLVATMRLPQIGIPSSGILRVAVGVNGAAGKDYEVAATSCEVATGRRPALNCTGTP